MKAGIASCIIAALVVGSGAAGSEERADAILGTWLTAGDDQALIRLYRDQPEGTIQGRIVELLEPRFPADDPTHPGEIKVDRENPDPELRGRAVEGLVIAEGFRFDGEGRWEDGSIYDPESGKTYSCRMWLTDDGRLKVRGYIGFSLLGRTEVWTRAEDVREQDGDGDGG